MKHLFTPLQRDVHAKQPLSHPAEVMFQEEQDAPARPDTIRTLVRGKKLAPAQRVALIQKFGQFHGNRHVQRLLVNRAPEPEAGAETNFKLSGTFESAAALKLPKPLTLKQSDVEVRSLGDYPSSTDTNNVMAMHEVQPSDAIQREEEKPGPGGSVQVGTSLESGWTLELEGSYDNLLLKNLLKKDSFKLDLKLSPKINFAAEKLNTRDKEVSLENGWTVMEAKWLPFWQREISAEISAYAKYTLVPQLRSEYGVKGEVNQNLVEKKIKDTTITLDLKFGVNGGWTSYNEETKKAGTMVATDASVNFKVSF